MKQVLLAALLALAVPATAQPIPQVNESCSDGGSLLVCPLQTGTRVYSVPSGKKNVWLTNYGAPKSVTRVRIMTFPGTEPWTEMSAYNWLGTCEAPPDHCMGSNLPPDRCPCQRDGDPGPGIKPIGAVGNLAIGTDGKYPDLTWGADGFGVSSFGEVGSYFVLGDKEHGSPGIMYAVTVKDGLGADVFRSPKVDHVVQGNGSVQVNAFEPWGPMTEDLTITGAQVYAVGDPNTPYGRTHVTYACFYIFDDTGQPPAWKLCGSKETATTGYFVFTKEIKKGQYLVGHAANVSWSAWDWVASFTAKRKL